MTDIANVLTRWQQGEPSGTEARQLTKARSFGDLYKWARRYDIEIKFKPRDLLAAVERGTMTDAAAAEALGSSEHDWQALKAALRAGPWKPPARLEPMMSLGTGLKTSRNRRNRIPGLPPTARHSRRCSSPGRRSPTSRRRWGGRNGAFENASGLKAGRCRGDWPETQR
jgi:hypothetical protein